MVQPEGISIGPQSQPRSAPSGRMVALAAAMVVLLVAAVLTTLRLTETWPFETTSSSVEEALDYIPADATSVQIRDQGAAEQRLGIDDIETGASDADIERYLKASRNAPWVANSYTPYLETMTDTTFTALDIDWSASADSGSAQDSAFITQLYGMDPDLDLGEVGDALVGAGWTESDVDGGRKFEVELTDIEPATMLAGGYPAGQRTMVLLPDEDLMITGDYEPVLDVIAGDAESMRTSDTVRELLDDADDAEYVHLTPRSGMCVDPAVLLLARRITPTPASMNQLRERIGSSGLGTPSATASLVLADGDTLTTTSRLLFDDGDDAAADRAAREEFLREGTDPLTREPIADVLEVDSMTVDGARVTIDYTFERGASALPSAVAVRNLLPTLCFPL